MRADANTQRTRHQPQGKWADNAMQPPIGKIFRSFCGTYLDIPSKQVLASEYIIVSCWLCGG